MQVLEAEAELLSLSPDVRMTESPPAEPETSADRFSDKDLGL